MKIVTIDVSAAASWLFPSQRTDAADALLESATLNKFVAPDIFAWEIGNQIGLRAKGDALKVDLLLQRLEAVEIDITPPLTASRVFSSIAQSLRWSLTLFDTAYLAHALAHGGALASRERRLIEGAVRVGVQVFDLRD